MRFFIMGIVNDLDHDMKIAKTVAVGGGAVSFSSIMEWLPSMIGLIASIIAIALSVFMIYVHYKRNKREEELHIQKMKKFRTRRKHDPKHLD